MAESNPPIYPVAIVGGVPSASHRRFFSHCAKSPTSCSRDTRRHQSIRRHVATTTGPLRSFANWVSRRRCTRSGPRKPWTAIPHGIPALGQTGGRSCSGAHGVAGNTKKSMQRPLLWVLGPATDPARADSEEEGPGTQPGLDLPQHRSHFGGGDWRLCG